MNMRREWKNRIYPFETLKLGWHLLMLQFIFTFWLCLVWCAHFFHIIGDAFIIFISFIMPLCVWKHPNRYYQISSLKKIKYVELEREETINSLSHPLYYYEDSKRHEWSFNKYESILNRGLEIYKYTLTGLSIFFFNCFCSVSL